MALKNGDQLLLDITNNMLEVLEGISRHNPNAPLGIEAVHLLDDITRSIKLMEPDLPLINRMKPIKPGSAVIDACLRASVLKVILMARTQAESSRQQAVVKA